MTQGCGNHGCKIAKPRGMGTNGPCVCWQRVQPLEHAAHIAIKTLEAHRQLIEELSGGDSVPTSETLRRHHAYCETAIAALDGSIVK
jgi:hypothetical protein